MWPMLGNPKKSHQHSSPKYTKSLDSFDSKLSDTESPVKVINLTQSTAVKKPRWWQIFKRRGNAIECYDDTMPDTFSVDTDVCVRNHIKSELSDVDSVDCFCFKFSSTKRFK